MMSYPEVIFANTNTPAAYTEYDGPPETAPRPPLPRQKTTHVYVETYFGKEEA